MYHVAVRIKLFLSLILLAGFAHAQTVTLPLWPEGNPEPYKGGAGGEAVKPGGHLAGGKPVSILTNVSKPTLAFYPAPIANNTGAMVVVFPGGGYRILAYDLEGTEVCTWLNSSGINCAVVKYRVPIEKKFPEDSSDLEDAQQAIRITRSHAEEWHLDPHRIGVLGFSAGGHLVVVLGNHSGFKRANEPSSETATSALPNFVVAIYPGYLAQTPELVRLADGIDPSAETPPTFLLQAADDKSAPVENVMVYAESLKQLKVPVELHVYAQGGHGYGLRPTALPVTHWPSLVETWLNTIHVLPGAATMR